VGDEATFSLKNKSEIKTEEETLENAMVPSTVNVDVLNEVGLSSANQNPVYCTLCSGIAN
jgi:hypothetical protein